MESKQYRSGPSPHTKPHKTTKRRPSGSMDKSGSTSDVKHDHKQAPADDEAPVTSSRPESAQSENKAPSRSGSVNSRADDVTHDTEDVNTAGDNNAEQAATPEATVEADMTSPTPSDDKLSDRQSPSNKSMSIYGPIDPQDFDTRSFFSSISDLSSRLQSASLTSMDTDFDADEMESVVSAVTVSMENFRNYTTYSQQQLEQLRGQLQDTKDKMHRKIALHPYDPRSGEYGMMTSLAVMRRN